MRDVITAMVILGAGLVLNAAGVRLMMRVERTQKRRTEHLKGLWRARGGDGLEPGKWG